MDDLSAKVWVRDVLDHMVPLLEASTVAMAVVPDGEHSAGDVKFWVELGAMIMLDKPIIAVAFGDRRVAPKLALVADEVVRLPDGVNPAASATLSEAIVRVVSNRPSPGTSTGGGQP
jgi:hypothetical protein